MELIFKAIESDLWSKNSRIEWLEKEKRELSETKEQLEKELQAKDCEIAYLKGTTDGLEKEIADLRKELDYYKNEGDDF